MPVVIPRNYVLLGLFALAVNSEFNYPYYFSIRENATKMGFKIMIGAIRRIPSISLQPCAASGRANANGQVLEQAVAAVGSLDQRKLGDYLKTHSFDTGKIEYASNGEWKNPRVLWVQYQNVKGSGLDQFKKAGTQVIIYPKELASGELQIPYSVGR
jgi:hypothetical protein